MDGGEFSRAMPAIRAAFDGFRQNLFEGRMNQASAALFGGAVRWGEQLRGIYARDDREALGARDPLTRFFVTRYRGMPTPAEIGDAPAEALFLMAFTAFPYVDALVEEMSIGEHAGLAEDGTWLVRRVVAETEDGGLMPVEKAERGWRFDLMPVYQAKAEAMATFIDAQYGGDFDAFLWRYVGDHDLNFDMEQAWRPLGGAA